MGGVDIMLLPMDMEYMDKLDTWSQGIDDFSNISKYLEEVEEYDGATIMGMEEEIEKKELAQVVEWTRRRKRTPRPRGRRCVNSFAVIFQRQEELKQDSKRKAEAVIDDSAAVAKRRAKEEPAKAQDTATEDSEEAKLERVTRKLKESYSKANIRRSIKVTDFSSVPVPKQKKGTSRERILKKINKIKRNSAKPSSMTAILGFSRTS